MVIEFDESSTCPRCGATGSRVAEKGGDGWFRCCPCYQVRIPCGAAEARRLEAQEVADRLRPRRPAGGANPWAS